MQNRSYLLCKTMNRNISAWLSGSGNMKNQGRTNRNDSRTQETRKGTMGDHQHLG